MCSAWCNKRHPSSRGHQHLSGRRHFDSAGHGLVQRPADRLGNVSTHGIISASAHLDTLICAYRDVLVRSHGFGPIRADVNLLVGTHLLRSVGADRDLFVRANVFSSIGTNAGLLIDAHCFRPIVLDLGLLIVVDDLGAVVAHPVGLVVLDLDVLVLLGVDEELFRALLVLESDLVEVGGAAALARSGLDARLGGIGRQRVWWHLVSVVDTARDNWLVGITLQEVDDYFLANTRQGNPTPVGAGPRAGDADPATRVLILLAIAVPMELHLHPAVLVGPDLLTGGSDHLCGLRTCQRGLGGHPGWPELLTALQNSECALIGSPLRG